MAARRGRVPEWEERFCYVVEFDQMHGTFESWYGSPCPKCTEYVDPSWSRDPRDDSYRRRLVEAGYSFHPAVDDWNPCFYGGLVGVRIVENTDGTARIRITGADDTAMSLGCPSVADAQEALKRLLAMSFIPMKGDLFMMGYYWD